MAYLHHYYEPDSNRESIRIQQRAKAYQIIVDELYKTAVTWPLLRYLSRDEGKELLAQIHSGMYGGHVPEGTKPPKGKRLKRHGKSTSGRATERRGPKVPGAQAK
jgi:hypothetical protein